MLKKVHKPAAECPHLNKRWRVRASGPSSGIIGLIISREIVQPETDDQVLLRPVSPDKDASTLLRPASNVQYDGSETLLRPKDLDTL